MAVFSLQNKKSSRTSNMILASMLFVFAVVSCCSLFKSITPLQIHSRYHRQLFALGHLAFLIGPLLYFYVRSLLDTEFTLRRRDWLHFLPFPVAVLCSILVFQQYDPFLIYKFRGRFLFSGSVLIQNLAYLVASFNILRSYGLTFRSFLSYIDNIKLAWVRFFISGYVVLWIIQLQLFLAWDAIESPPWCPYARSLYFLTTFVLFNGMVYIGLRKPEIFHQGQKYQGSLLNKSDKEQYQEKLSSLMNQEKLYLSPALSLTEIAQRLDIAPRYVSQIINETCQQNFHEFVNRYRVEESKRLMAQQNQYLNILGIALDAGFNSKSAFNKAFKRNTGMTPKEFKKRLSFGARS
jgi:AraC-like DNA-binding protein